MQCKGHTSVASVSFSFSPFWVSSQPFILSPIISLVALHRVVNGQKHKTDKAGAQCVRRLFWIWAELILSGFLTRREVVNRQLQIPSDINRGLLFPFKPFSSYCTSFLLKRSAMPGLSASPQVSLFSDVLFLKGNKSNWWGWQKSAPPSAPAPSMPLAVGFCTFPTSHRSVFGLVPTYPNHIRLWATQSTMQYNRAMI